MNNTDQFLPIIFFIIAAIVALLWLLFPIVVWSGLNELQKQLRKTHALQEDQLARLEDQQRLMETNVLQKDKLARLEAALKSLGEKQDRTNQLLEWLGTKGSNPGA